MHDYTSYLNVVSIKMTGKFLSGLMMRKEQTKHLVTAGMII